jgi:acyl carrier protein phosphodiesterase
MNWLAHAFLSDATEELLLGSLLGDFFRPADRSSYSEEIWTGIRLHREIDRFTDSHALFRQSIRRLSPDIRFFGGVLVDIFYDHILARNWASYSCTPLGEYSSRYYAVLRRHIALLPPRLRRILPIMEREDWFSAYATTEGIYLSLSRLEQRFRSPRVSFADQGVEDLKRLYPELSNDFEAFFMELRHFAGERLAALVDCR